MDKDIEEIKIKQAVIANEQCHINDKLDSLDEWMQEVRIHMQKEELALQYIKDNDILGRLDKLEAFKLKATAIFSGLLVIGNTAINYIWDFLIPPK